MTELTQVERLVLYLRSHPGASGLELVTALSMPKYTSRISDARAQGIDIVCEKRPDGRNGYRLADGPLTLGLA
jgi:Helix-turn-helix domain